MISIDMKIVPTVENVRELGLRDLTLAVADIIRRTFPAFEGKRNWLRWLEGEQASGTLPKALATWATDALDNGDVGDLEACVLLLWLDSYHAMSLTPPCAITAEQAQDLDRLLSSL